LLGGGEVMKIFRVVRVVRCDHAFDVVLLTERDAQVKCSWARFNG
jgi:hypothetical protein